LGKEHHSRVTQAKNLLELQNPKLMRLENEGQT